MVWLFDVADAIDEEKIQSVYDQDNKYLWSCVPSPFKKIEQISNEKATVYFQIGNTNDDSGVIERVTNSYKFFSYFYADSKNRKTSDEFADIANNNAWRLCVHQKEQKYDSIAVGMTIEDICSSVTPNSFGIVVENLSDHKEMVINLYATEPQRKRGLIVGKYSNYKNGNWEYSKIYPVKNADQPIWKLKKIFQNKKKQL